MLAILDYGAGNQTSVRRALEHLGIPCGITGNPEEALAAEGIVFPGVGAAGQAMSVLEASGLGAALRHAVMQKKPLLGICLGCQILLEYSEENETTTLGILAGRSRRFTDSLRQEDGSRAPIPHMGWNVMTPVRESVLLRGLPEKSEFYFVHSYYVEPAPELVLATTTYGQEFCSLYGYDGLWAAQCHLEKSGRAGLLLLENFYAFCQAKGEGKPC